MAILNKRVLKPLYSKLRETVGTQRINPKALALNDELLDSLSPSAMELDSSGDNVNKLVSLLSEFRARNIDDETPKRVAAFMKLQDPTITHEFSDLTQDVAEKTVLPVIKNDQSDYINTLAKIMAGYNKDLAGAIDTKNLSPQEIMAVNLYTRGYDDLINDVSSRTADDELRQILVDNLVDATAKQTTNRPLSVFRGVRDNETFQGLFDDYGSYKPSSTIRNAEIGDVIDTGRFTSTSLDPSAASVFGDTILKIDLPSGHNVIVPNKVNEFASQFPEEFEVLLPASSKFRVKDLYNPGLPIPAARGINYIGDTTMSKSRLPNIYLEPILRRGGKLVNRNK